MVDNALLTELIAKQRQAALEQGLRTARLLDLALDDAPHTGLRTAIASALTRVAMRIDAAASARATAAHQ